MVNGGGLKIHSQRSSRVRIPPSASWTAIILVLFASLVCRAASDVIRSKALLVLGERCRHRSATGFAGYIYNSGKVN